MNSLILGDCLQTLQKLPSESVDLIYIDPPFFSNRTYEVIWGDKGEIRSFEDRFSGGIDHYISWLKERVIEIHRILKPTGSFYLHCDWHADAYIRVYILDKIFGENNFRGQIIWKRANSHNDAKNKLAVLTDTIWYYSKSSKLTYNPIYASLSEKYKADFYKHKDEKGIYRLGDLNNTRPGGYIYDYKDYKPHTNGWRCPLETMEKWDKEGLINFPKNKNGRLSFKRYLDNSKGTLMGNFWDDIGNVQSSKERIGYPTQKPEKLLERIILASSNEGDVVLDCFVGGGTTVAVAERLGRQWIGIDQSVQAIKVSEFRLNNAHNLFSEPFEVRLHKYDYDTLRYKDAFEFETWIVEKFGGVGNLKQRGDLGLDGKDKTGKPIQVKRSDNIGRNVVDNFVSAAKRYDKNLFEKSLQNLESVGTIIAFSFGKGAIQEVARLKNEDKIIIDLITVADIIPIAKKPDVKLIVELLEKSEKSENYKFTIKAIAENDSQIEFYSFEILELKLSLSRGQAEGLGVSIRTDYRNISGQIEQELKPGKYKIIAKAIDNNGLEGLDEVEIVVK